MRISTKGRYGTRAMLMLAANYPDGLTAAGQIADHEEISPKYLENIFGTLKACGLVVSERGKGGGYALSRPPQEISLHDILEPLEEALDIVHCTGNGHGCERSSVCATREVWREIKQATDRILIETTLADLLRRQLHLRVRNKAQ